MRSSLLSKREESEFPHKLELNKIFYQLSSLIAFVTAVVWVGRSVLGFNYIMLYLCLWFFGSAVMALIYPENYIVNSFLLTSTTLVAIFSIFIATFPAFDYVHIPPMLMAFVLIILNKPISLKLLWVYTGLTPIWYAIVRNNFIYVGYPHPLLVLFAQIFNASFITLIYYYRKIKNNRFAQRYGSLILISGILLFATVMCLTVAIRG
jgi:hypothetical protein